MDLQFLSTFNPSYHPIKLYARIMKRILIFIVGIACLSSCKLLVPSLMLKTPKNYQYAKDSSIYKANEYKISANDVIDFRIYANGGFRLTDVTTQQNSSSSNAASTTVNNYPVDFEGNVKLPVLGKTHLAGLTISEAELALEEKYALYYNSPFVIVKVTSNRVFVFPGVAGQARVVPLTYQNTTLMEVLANSGGVATDGKAYDIKLIRKNNGKSDVYHVDLSTIEGLKFANIVLQGGDIIYVEPRLRFAVLLANELNPILTLFSTVLLAGTTILLLKH